MTFLGILMGIGVMVYAIISVEAPYKSFINEHGILIVLGGIIASTLISFRAPDLGRGLWAFIVVFIRGKHNLLKEVERIAELAALHGREGLAGLEQAVQKLRGTPLKDGLTLHLNGYKWPEIQRILEDSTSLKWEREQVEIRMFRQMGKAAPAFGMVGTVVGLIFMLSQLRDQPDKIGPYLAVALTATLYGLFMANVVFYPMAEKLTSVAEENVILGKLWLDATQLIVEKRHPLYVKDRLAVYVTPRERARLMAGPKTAAATPAPARAPAPARPAAPR